VRLFPPFRAVTIFILAPTAARSTVIGLSVGKINILQWLPPERDAGIDGQFFIIILIFFFVVIFFRGVNR